MDLVTIGIIVFTVLVAVVSIYFFKIVTRETTFEEAYGQNALRLLTEEKAQKLKPKQAKIKKNGKPADKEKHAKEVVHSANVEEDVAQVNKAELELSQANNGNETEAGEVNASAKKNKKRNRARKSENDVDNASSAEKEKVVPEDQASNKRILENVEEPVKLVETKSVAAAPQSKETKPAAPQRQKKNVNNINDVVSYLKGIENVEPEYITALLSIKDQQSAKEAKLQDTISNLKKEKNDKENSSKQLLNELYNLQKDNLKLKSELKLQQDKYETFEETVRNKLTETIQLKEENKRLSNAVAQGSQNATQYQQVVREAEALRAEYTKKLNAVTEELNASKQIIEKLKADNANICRDAMSAKANYEKEFADLKHAGELLKAKDQELQAAQIHIVEASKEIDRASTACAELKKSHAYQLEQIEALKAQNETIHAEKNAIHNELSAWKAKCSVAEDQLQQVASGNDHFCNQLNELSVEVQELRSFKNKYAEVQNINNELQTQKSELTKKLEAVQNQLSELEKQYKAETAKALNLKQLQAENEKLKNEIRSLSAKAAPETEDNSELVKQLKAQLEDQKSRCQELRNKNFKLLEIVQTNENNNKPKKEDKQAPKNEWSLDDVVSATSNCLRDLSKAYDVELSPPKEKCKDVKEFSNWLSKSVGQLKTKSATLTASKAAAAKPSLTQSSKDETVENLEKQVKHYGNALQILKDQLSSLEKVADEVDREQRAKISQLEAALKKLKRQSGQPKSPMGGAFGSDSPLINISIVQSGAAVAESVVSDAELKELKSSGSEEWEVVSDEVAV